MGINLKWLDEDRTLLSICFEGVWQLGECASAIGEAFSTISANEKNTNLLFDFSKNATVPKGPITEQCAYVFDQLPSNTGLIGLTGLPHIAAIKLANYLFSIPATKQRTCIFSTPERASMLCRGLNTLPFNQRLLS